MTRDADIHREMTWLPTSDTPLTEAAIAYASHGIRVLPVWGLRATLEGVKCECGKACGDSAGKHPIGLAWQKRATVDADVVRDARRAYPNANVGLAMGGLGRLMAVDIDGDAGRASWRALEEQLGAAPVTLTSRSGRSDGGEHLIFRVPAHLDLRRIGNRVGILPGIDTRGDNGQVVAPPSLHRSGARYEFAVRAPIAEIPDALFEALATPAIVDARRPAPQARVVRIANAYVAKVILNATRDIADAPQGKRNSLLFAKSATTFEYCIGERIDHAEPWRALAQAGLACGLGRKEVELTLNKAWKAAMDSPRYAPAPQSASRAARRETSFAEASSVAADAGGGSEAPRSSSSDAHGGDVEVDDAARAVDDGRWEGELTRSSEGGFKNTFGNICKILRHAPAYRGRLSFHEMRVAPQLDDVSLRDADVGRIREHIEATWFFAPSQENTVQAIQNVSAERSFHPVRKYLSSLAWDGTPRIASVATEILGIAEPTPLQLRVVRAWFIAAVARAMQPGCKVDTALVLVGPQGFRKSTFFATLGGEWFSDSHMDITTKDGILQLHSAWIYEWAEIENVTSRKQAAEVKAFITCATDAVRPPFARAVANQPRSTIIVGTTNEEQFLDDPTGSRRFWILKIEQFIAIDTLRAWRDALWAEAVAAYKAGETWWLEQADEEEREKAADRHRLDDPWEEPIRKWLANHAKTNPSVPITTHKLLSEALGLDHVHQHPSAMGRAGKCMRRLGYDNRERRSQDNAASARAWTKVSDLQGIQPPGRRKAS